MTEIHDIRREYGANALLEENLPQKPDALMASWVRQAITAKCLDSTAFVLATMDRGFPDARIVLLKDINKQGLTFYTNYESAKARQLEKNPNVCACFYWSELSRQVRVTGKVEKLCVDESSAYFKSRPVLSQIAAIVSPQSETIPSRQWLEDRVEKMRSQTLECPSFWGGYEIVPNAYEFFQGRDSRLHDRFKAEKEGDEAWKWSRLAP
jgi:pyridoxamine 5'-phosphate oxidase